MPFGIDFGTTNSSIAWATGDGDIVVLDAGTASGVLPSLVHDPRGSATVGEGAREAAARAPDRPLLRSFKPDLDEHVLRERQIRTAYEPSAEYDPVEENAKLVRRTVVTFRHGDYTREEVVDAGAAILDTLTRARLSAVDAAACLPQAAKRRAEELQRQLAGLAGDGSPEAAVFVGVPVAFGGRARSRMLDAFARSGLFGPPDDDASYRRALNGVRFIFEPLGILADQEPASEQKTLIFDYGGGTLDLALIRTEYPQSSEGVPVHIELGLGALHEAGDHVDDLIEDWLAERYPGDYVRSDRVTDPIARNLRREAITRAKEALSVAEATEIDVDGQRIILRAADVAEAVGPHLEAIDGTIAALLEAADMDFEAVDAVIMSGGSSLLAVAQRHLRGLFPHLDEITFTAPRPDHPEGRLRALTGVSRGLAQFGFLDGFEEHVTTDYLAEAKPGEGESAVCVQAGAREVDRPEDAPATPLQCPHARPTSVAIYSTLVQKSHVGTLANCVEAAIDEVTVRVAASRQRAVPAFTVADASSGRELGTFDLSALSDSDLKRFISEDRDELPLDAGPVSDLTKPVKIGDRIRWSAGGRTAAGIVKRIRHVQDNKLVKRTEGTYARPYVFDVEDDAGTHHGINPIKHGPLSHEPR